MSLTSLEGLATLENLSSLSLSGCERLTDISVLANLPNLSTLNLSKCSLLPESHQRSWHDEELLDFLRSLSPEAAKKKKE